MSQTKDFTPILPVQEITPPLALKDSGDRSRFNQAAESNLTDMRQMALDFNNNVIPAFNTAMPTVNTVFGQIDAVYQAAVDSQASAVASAESASASANSASDAAVSETNTAAMEGHVEAMRDNLMDGATPEATPGSAMRRDDAGRTQVADPEQDLDAANRGWVNQEIGTAIMSMQGGLKTPVPLDLESDLPDPATAAHGDYYVISNMDVTKPNFQGRAWLNTDVSATEWQTVVDLVQTPDGEYLVLTGDGKTTLSASAKTAISKVDTPGRVMAAIPSRASLAEAGSGADVAKYISPDRLTAWAGSGIPGYSRLRAWVITKDNSGAISFSHNVVSVVYTASRYAVTFVSGAVDASNVIPVGTQFSSSGYMDSMSFSGNTLTVAFRHATTAQFMQVKFGLLIFEGV